MDGCDDILSGNPFSSNLTAFKKILFAHLLEGFDIVCEFICTPSENIDFRTCKILNPT